LFLAICEIENLDDE